MARKIKFHFNPETLSYEKVQTTLYGVLKTVGLHLLTSLFSGAIFFFIFIWLVESPEEKRLSSENARMKVQYKVMERRMSDLQGILSDLQQRDDNLYRVVFQADPIPYEVRRSSMGNKNRYEEFSDMSNARLLSETAQHIDDLSKQTYIQSQSYDELVKLAKENKLRLEHIPAIQPILNKDLRRVASGFGIRIDPIYRRPKMHQGMDFTAPIGTDIYSTGNGLVVQAGWQQGYGNAVKINHGFGYETLYGHMHKVNVRKGQRVNRGDAIGKVGNTGKSTGPHLHYEVRYQGKPVNPQNYYFLDLSPEQYDEMVQLSQNAGQVFD
ncbi:MAG: M23 family metallopeptidase [Paludibacteraceae bacterium]|nr:M23 family metallopeptidase [Paludibacteraceae bacterium]